MFLVMLPSLIMLIYAYLVKITTTTKSYFLISGQILFKFGIQDYGKSLKAQKLQFWAHFVELLSTPVYIKYTVCNFKSEPSFFDNL